MNALEKLKMVESDSVDLLEKEMIPYLEKAYQSIKQQRNWNFDPYLAAKIEFQIIFGNLNGSSFEVVQDLMLAEADQRVMLEIAKTSKEFLNSIK